MTRPHDNDPVYDMDPERTPAVRDEPMPDHLDEYRDVHAEELPTRGPVTETTVETKVKNSVAGGTWAALIIGALLLIALLVFILQNQQQVELNILSWTFHFPAGIGYLFSAITGALIMALVGGVRMFELRRQVKRQRKLLG
ncbi:LapA family protein [Corynebacterium nasicanis]|uniref:Lipopolysaccharide assembly LapA domain-containing protein n=1 Tax=Corynebacterium nasicanis TaxID=1448267 RepID=A0ABW1Q7P6_9CORY